MTKFPSPFVVLPFVLFCMVAIIAFACVADCVRLDNAASSLVHMADQDQLAFELQMIALLKNRSSLPYETHEAVKQYDRAKDSAERHAAFLHLAQVFESTTASIQESRFTDNVRGLANRWSVSMKLYQTQLDNLQEYRQSRRGKIASWFVRH